MLGYSNLNNMALARGTHVTVYSCKFAAVYLGG